jgi:hypothetical protein
MAKSSDEIFDPSVPASPSSIYNQSLNASLEDQTILLLAGLMEAGQEDEDTCKELANLTKLLTDDSSDETRSPEPHKPLYQLVDADSVDTILGFLDMRQSASVRGYATLAISAYLKASGDKGVDLLSKFFHSKVRKGTYDDFIVAFSVAASIFPIVPDVTAALFLSEGFVANLGSLMRRKWKSKKVEQSALEMLNVACMNTPCREAIKKYCTEWLEDMVATRPPESPPIDTQESKQIEDGTIQQGIHSASVVNLAAVVLAKLQVGVVVSLQVLLEFLQISTSASTNCRGEGSSCYACSWYRRRENSACNHKYGGPFRHVQEYALRWAVSTKCN